MGSVFNLLSSYNFEIFGNLETWGKLFFYDAMVTSFILGVGGRLIPGILGFVEIVKNQRQIYESSHSFFKVIPVGIYISLFTFIMSFLLEGAGLLNTGYLSRAVVITYFSFRYWRLHEKVKTEKWHGRILKVSCFFLLIATWLLCFFKDYIIDIKHLIYIGSYCLMTLMVASRVVLAHGKAGLGFEHRTFPYLLIGGLVSLAALTRATAQFVSDSYFEHLGYTGLILLLAVLVWLTSFLCKIILHK
ncbi:MAG: NnrS family protein [Flavobacteriaceae bacterium]|nr:NnrS family protein [Flavobacteriaceae bacterium]